MWECGVLFFYYIFYKFTSTHMTHGDMWRDFIFHRHNVNKIYASIQLAHVLCIFIGIFFGRCWDTRETAFAYLCLKMCSWISGKYFRTEEWAALSYFAWVSVSVLVMRTPFHSHSFLPVYPVSIVVCILAMLAVFVWKKRCDEYLSFSRDKHRTTMRERDNGGVKDPSLFPVYYALFFFCNVSRM